MALKADGGPTKAKLVSPKWELATLGELEQRKRIKLYRGQVISQKDIDREPGAYPIYSSSVQQNGLFGRYGKFMFDEELITWSIDGGGNFFYRPPHRFSVTNVCGYMRVDAATIDCRFLAYQLQHLHGRQSFDYLLKAHPSVIRGLYAVPLPPLPEQRAIAAALGDVDALITGLDQLVAKRRDIKQATMQQLLTRRRRLPGFSGEWKVKRLGELGSTFGGLTGKTKSDFGEGAARYVTFMNIMSHVVLAAGAFERVNVSPGESQHKVMKGDVFFNGSSETPEEVGMCAVLLDDVENVYLNSFCFGFRFGGGGAADGLYMAYYFRSGEGRELLYSLAQGATRYNLSKTSLLRLAFPLPSYPEQIAIATVFSDMDAEIAAREARREKTRALKQGMMQQLLTGRTRLV